MVEEMSHMATKAVNTHDDSSRFLRFVREVTSYLGLRLSFFGLSALS
jgi:hypothetical protein